MKYNSFVNPFICVTDVTPTHLVGSVLCFLTIPTYLRLVYLLVDRGAKPLLNGVLSYVLWTQDFLYYSSIHHYLLYIC